jgi:hypothetical protein
MTASFAAPLPLSLLATLPVGLLLLNRSVYSGAHILTCPQDVPEQCFPLQAQPQCDTLLDLRPLQQQLVACSSSSSAVAACGSGSVLTPDLHRLYSLLEETQRAMPGRSQKQQQQQEEEASAGADVAGIMQQALRKCTVHGRQLVCSLPARY